MLAVDAVHGAVVGTAGDEPRPAPRVVLHPAYPSPRPRRAQHVAVTRHHVPVPALAELLLLGRLQLLLLVLLLLVLLLVLLLLLLVVLLLMLVVLGPVLLAPGVVQTVRPDHAHPALVLVAGVLLPEIAQIVTWMIKLNAIFTIHQSFHIYLNSNLELY